MTHEKDTTVHKKVVIKPQTATVLQQAEDTGYSIEDLLNRGAQELLLPSPRVRVTSR
jgi:hypothetical protein